MVKYISNTIPIVGLLLRIREKIINLNWDLNPVTLSFCASILVIIQPDLCARTVKICQLFCCENPDPALLIVVYDRRTIVL